MTAPVTLDDLLETQVDVLRFTPVKQLGNPEAGEDYTVWLAHDNSGAEVVMKFSTTNRPRPTRDHIRKEAVMLANLHSEGTRKDIIPFYAFGETPAQSFLFTPYVDTKNLRATFRDKTTKQVVQIAMQMLDTLGAVHRNDYMHLDAKLRNWLDTSSDDPADTPSILLIDFDTAKERDYMSETKSPGGTPGYSAPEQFLFMQSNGLGYRRSDVWTVGANLHEMITGHLPFGVPRGKGMIYYAKHALEMKYMSLFQKPRSQHKDIPQAVLDVNKQMLAYDPAERPSLLEARNMLAKAIGEPELILPHQQPPTYVGENFENGYFI